MDEVFNAEFAACYAAITETAQGAAEIFDKLLADDFADPRCRTCYALAKKAHDSGAPVDALAIIEGMKQAGIEHALEFMNALTDAYFVRSAIPSYVAQVKRAAKRRHVQGVAFAIQQALESDEPENIANRAIASLMALGETNSDSLRDLRDIARSFLTEVERRHESDGEIQGLPTGFPAIDARMDGLKRGNLIIVAGRPAMGKSTFALNLAQHTAIALNKPTLIFSMEMSGEELVEKISASVSGTALDHIKSGTCVQQQDNRWSIGVRRLISSPLFIDERGGLTLAQVRSRAIQVQRKHGLELIVVDYLQLMTGDDARKGGNRESEISSISRGLKALAKELKIPVVALSQLSRACESRADKRPLLSDLRESGAIEQDADVIIFPYRHEYYEGENTPNEYKGVAEIIFRKLRMGAVGSEYLRFEGALSRFSNMSHVPRSLEDIQAERAAQTAAQAAQKQKGRGFNA